MFRQIGTAAAISISLTACVSTSSVLPIGRDTYSVSSTADGFRTAASARQDAYEEGQKKCAETGTQFQMLHESTAPTRMGIDTTVSVTFRCLAGNDPEYTRPVVKPTPTAAIEDTRR